MLSATRCASTDQATLPSGLFDWMLPGQSVAFARSLRATCAAAADHHGHGTQQ
jgi:hypothetical protein